MTLAEFKQQVPHPLRQATLVFLMRGNEVLLAMKKRGFGAGRWNGVGGKVEEGELVREAAMRETEEEIGVQITEVDEVARLQFYFPHVAIEKHWNQEVEVYVATEWEGVPKETDEMRPVWFAINAVPYAEMWSDDILWLPHVIHGRRVYAEFSFSAEQEVEELEVTLLV
jgi:8-oxo-dGTP pyrophosphatase MutT (NUDIX family)